MLANLMVSPSGAYDPLCGGGLLGVWSQDLPVLSIE